MNQGCWTCGEQPILQDGWRQCSRCKVWNCPECLWGCWFFLSYCDACEREYCNLCSSKDMCPDCGELGNLIYAYGEDCKDKRIFRLNGYWYNRSEFTETEIKMMMRPRC
jgi:hypothetical protein